VARGFARKVKPRLVDVFQEMVVLLAERGNALRGAGIERVFAV
jgi:hypothetical protein